MIKFVRWNILFKNQTTSSCQQVFYYIRNKPFRLSVIRLSVVAPSSVNKNDPPYQHPDWQMAVVRVLFCLYFKSEGQRWIFVIKNSILSSSKISRSHSTKLFFWQNLEIFAETILAEPTLLGFNAPIVFSSLSETTVFVRWLNCDQW